VIYFLLKSPIWDATKDSEDQILKLCAGDKKKLEKVQNDKKNIVAQIKSSGIINMAIEKIKTEKKFDKQLCLKDGALLGLKKTNGKITTKELQLMVNMIRQKVSEQKDKSRNEIDNKTKKALDF